MLEVDLYTEDGILGRGAAPTGTSVGMYEAFILRDGGTEYHGLSVHKAETVVEKVIAPALIGMVVDDLAAIDQRMLEIDGTKDKHVLGSNSTYSVSIAALRAAAASHKQHVYQYLAQSPLPTIPLPTFNVLNGGCNNGVTQAFNEFILAPYKANSVFQAMEIAVAVYQRLETMLAGIRGVCRPDLGSSYGWAAPSNDPEEVLGLLAQAVADCGYADKVCYCLDCASSEMYDGQDNTYELKGRRVGADELITYARQLTEKYDLLFIEDLLDENDWDGFVRAHKILTRTNLIGDDLIASNVGRLGKAYELNAIDGFILKPNQVGTITEALATHDFATRKGLVSIPSGRSGGTVGDIIVDLSLGLLSPFSKNGAPRSGERLDKMNTLLRAATENPSSTMADLSRYIRF